MSVMNVKRSAQTFSKAEQTSAMKNDVSHSASATAEQQAMGDQNVGDVLNKVADPNWVDPSKKVRAAGNNQLDKDAFLKLMLTQMKYQDPTNPMQSHEMAAQLAQFTSLEQLNNINMTLSGMSKAQQPQTNYQALALIGKKISGDSSKVMRSAGDTKHGIGFELMGDAGKVRITIKDSAGTLVKKLDVGALKKGANTVEWNGLNEEGSAARPGEYRVSVEGVSNTGAKIYAKTSFEGRITGLNYTQEGPVLLVGNKSVKLSEVKKIEESGPEDAAPGAGAPAIDLKSGTGESAKADQMKSILAMMSKQKGPGVAGAIGAGASAGAVLGSQSVQAPSAALNPTEYASSGCDVRADFGFVVCTR
jgi:flagellar basal-body rod modification protein FlgD